MIQLSELFVEIEQKLTQLRAVRSVRIYRDALVVVDVASGSMQAGLDVTVDGDVFLVARTSETLETLSKHLNRRLGGRSKIVESGKSITALSTAKFSNSITDTLIDLVNEIVAIEQNPSRFLAINNQHMEALAKQAKLQGYRELCIDMSDYLKDRLIGIPSTLKLIKDEQRSVARFGDGEIKTMVTATGCRFQKHDWVLMQELRDIVGTKSDLLVCFPSLMSEDIFWQKFWPEFWPACRYYLNQDIIGDSMVTRPEAFYFYGKKVAEQWMNVWSGKNVCFVTGESSRMNGNHILFSTAKSSTYVHSKNNDAFEEIYATLEKCLAQKEADVFLIALGPTGTALASRLQREGKWAIDIGHLNNSYDMLFNNAPKPEKVPYSRN